LSVTFPPAPLPQWPPGGTDAAEVRAQIDRWARSAAMKALVRCFGGEPPGPAEDAIAKLTAFSEVWDYRRGGLERGEIEAVDYDDEIDELVCQATLALGLGGSEQPPSQAYDHVLVLGGGPRTALARPHFAAHMLNSSVTAGHVAALSSLRPLGDAEIELAHKYGMRRVRVEADVMACGMARAFGANSEPVRRDGTTPAGAPWSTLEFSAAGRCVAVVAAASVDPSRRANTADTVTGWAELIQTPRRDHHLLVVTTDLFVPFQHADAVRLLGCRSAAASTLWDWTRRGMICG